LKKVDSGLRRNDEVMGRHTKQRITTQVLKDKHA
jgi:hypothetical protein